jgi:hypothetical protein
MSFEDSFGAYTREDLQEALRSIDLEKNPEITPPSRRS